MGASVQECWKSLTTRCRNLNYIMWKDTLIRHFNVDIGQEMLHLLYTVSRGNIHGSLWVYLEFWWKDYLTFSLRESLLHQLCQQLCIVYKASTICARKKYFLHNYYFGHNYILIPTFFIGTLYTTSHYSGTLCNQWLVDRIFWWLTG